MSLRISHDGLRLIAHLICTAPPSSARFGSWSEDDAVYNATALSSVQRAELDMVKAYTERWATNDKLDSTYWQGTQALSYRAPSVSIYLRLTIYNTEQA